MSNFILLYHRGKNMTISQFIERNYIYNIEPKDLFEINRDFIWSQMSESDKKERKKTKGKYPESSADLDVNMILPSPCSLKIDPSKVTAEIAINQTNYQVNTSDFYSFENEKIQELFQNEGYKIDTTTKRNLDCRVFGWFKSLYFVGLNPKDKVSSLGKSLSEFSDLSSHVISLATTVVPNGGSFVLKLPVSSSRSSGLLTIGNQDEKGIVEP